METATAVQQRSHALIYLWLLADGRHRNMMTNRMMEKRKPQKASSIHSSLQSCTHASHQKTPGSRGAGGGATYGQALGHLKGHLGPDDENDRR